MVLSSGEGAELAVALASSLGPSQWPKGWQPPFREKLREGGTCHLAAKRRDFNHII